MPPEEIFRKKILIRLLELRRVCPGVRVALVPASAGAKELCDGGYVGLPQPGLDKRLHGIPEVFFSCLPPDGPWAQRSSGGVVFLKSGPISRG